MSADTAQFTVRSELFAFAQGLRCGMVNEVRKRGVRDFFSAVNNRIGLVVGAGLVLFFFWLRERSGPSGLPAAASVQYQPRGSGGQSRLGPIQPLSPSCSWLHNRSWFA